MRITIGNFAREGLEIESGLDLASGLKRALDEYVDRIDNEDPTLLPPLFSIAPEGDVVVTLSVEPDREIWIIEESARRGCSIDELASDAIIHHLARLEASRRLRAR